MSEQDKPREFWITIDEMQDDGTSRDYVYEQDPKGMFEYHVIEHSAYKKAQAEIESQSKLLFERDKRIDDLKRENIKLKATQEKLVGLIKLAQNLPGRSREDGCKNWDSFMRQSEETLNALAQATKGEKE